MPFRNPNVPSAPETGNAPIKQLGNIPGPGRESRIGPPLTPPPVKFPFPPGSIPGPPQGMTLPDQRDAEKYPFPAPAPFDFKEKMKGLMEWDDDTPQQPQPLPWELLTPEQRKWVI